MSGNGIKPMADSIAERKILHIEFLRILAILLVMFNHTGERGFFLFARYQESSFFPFYIFISILCKIAVPIFFMISGALLLDKRESIAEVCKKRVFRYLILLIVISGCYYVYDWYCRPWLGGSLKLGDFWKHLYTNDIGYALWYLYAYIGLLVMLPLLRKLVQGMDEKDYRYLFICYFFLTGIIPVMEYFFGEGTIRMTKSFDAPLVTSYSVFYFVMGYYIEKVMDKEKFNWRNISIGAMLGVAVIGVSCYMTMYKAKLTGELNESVSQSFHSCLIAIPAINVYVSAKYVFMKVNIGPFLKKIIQILGSTAFGVYLLQEMLMPHLEFVAKYLDPRIRTFPACLVWLMVVYVVGVLITLVLKRIPIIKKYI